MLKAALKLETGSAQADQDLTEARIRTDGPRPNPALLLTGCVSLGKSLISLFLSFLLSKMEVTAVLTSNEILYGKS